ncbi:hypothetical protein [Pelagicoccus sp. SDUM812002]|uniref:hypothetical protein n=1 Tax=Pelagicoccus sp. SDUM812002 TaxID=3041266 RepID=UPI00280E1543|nr:hypothetical protein [Pelagicoccus sp. SDUM812002]MDQ8187724.1 hypothetical protein [Pelagicoccus sp. SDUM812002]
MPPRKRTSPKKDSSARFWFAADKLRNNTGATVRHPCRRQRHTHRPGAHLSQAHYPALSRSTGSSFYSDQKLLEAFHKLYAPLYEQAESNRAQSRNLANLRDTLLPKLLSGELTPV